MKELNRTQHIARKTCRSPDPRIMAAKGKPSKDPLSSEETGSFWLWAWPDLLGWPFKVTWLFSPVTGKAKWPGDLWGLDDRGNLLIVETKLSKRGGIPQDPFKDFVDFEKGPKAKVREGFVIEVPALRSRWLRLLKQEREFIENTRSILLSGNFELMKHPGVVPYSYKRSQTWTWWPLYNRDIVPKILGKHYERKAELNLLERKKQGNPKPHYFALFTVYDEGSPSLSVEGLKNYNALCRIAGENHVHLVGLKATPVPRNLIEVRSWLLTLNGSAK